MIGKKAGIHENARYLHDILNSCKIIIMASNVETTKVADMNKIPSVDESIGKQ